MAVHRIVNHCSIPAKKSNGFIATSVLYSRQSRYELKVAGVSVLLRYVLRTSEKITIKPKIHPHNIPETVEIYKIEDIASLAFGDRSRGWIYKIWTYDERWLLPLIGEDASSKGATVVQDNGVHRIDLTRNRAWALLKFFLDSLESLREATKRIINNKRTEDAAKYKDKSMKLGIKRALDDISKAMRRISKRTYLTPSIWRVMYSVESTPRHP